MFDDGKFRDRYRIKTARLPQFNYGQNGYYFVTICTKNREEYFGQVIDDTVRLSDIGEIAHRCWMEIPIHFSCVNIDEFIVMPNHIHGILAITKNEDIPGKETQDVASLPQKNRFGPQSENLASIIRGFKAGVTKYARRKDIPFAWQPRFYDHIIRNEESLRKIREYILENPMNWSRDKNNTENLFI